jgi:hypothetical protein
LLVTASFIAILGGILVSPGAEMQQDKPLALLRQYSLAPSLCAGLNIFLSTIQTALLLHQSRQNQLWCVQQHQRRVEHFAGLAELQRKVQDPNYVGWHSGPGGMGGGHAGKIVRSNAAANDHAVLNIDQVLLRDIEAVAPRD